MAFTFLKKGAASLEVAKKQAIETEQRKEQAGKLLRFWLTEGEKARVTFIDGELSPKGILVPDRWYEHTLFLNGQYSYFVCPAKTNPESGEVCPLDLTDRPSLVAGFTIIDHRTYKSAKSDKVYVDTRKILVAKPQNFEILNAIAIKRGGLAGATMEISRIGDKSSSIGSLFDFEEKKPIEVLQKMYMREVTDPKTNQKSKVTYFIPANFEEEIVYRTGDELRAMGLGQVTNTANAPAWVKGESNKEKVNYADKF